MLSYPYVASKTNVLGVILLALLLVGLLVGIVVFGIKLTRRCESRVGPAELVDNQNNLAFLPV
jgi:hypothetical protein